MAKLTVELDTETQEISVTVNGETVSNVQCVSVYNKGYYYDSNEKMGFDVSTSEKGEQNLTRVVRLTASEKEAEKHGGKASATFAGLFEIKEDCQTQAQKDIAELFATGRKL